MSAYYNEWSKSKARWLRQLIADGLIPRGDVDERSIKDVKPDDLKGYKQCHFFAGIGGWAAALKWAGWPDDRPVWTGSCPCQPFSDAGNKAAQSDERHLWPHWYSIIRQSKPATVFGEQVDSAVAFGWLDEVGMDLESQNYAFASAQLPACASGAPHIRERIWFVADYTGNERKSTKQETRDGWALQSDALSERVRGKDGMWASQGYQPPLPLLAHGIPGRMGGFEGYGDAIVPEIAQAFIEAFMEIRP